MERDFHPVIRIERLKGGRLFRVVDGIEPDSLRQRLLFEHWRVVRGIDRAEARRKRAHTLFAVHLQIQNVDHERTAGFRPFDIERARERIVSLDERKAVAGLLQRVAEAVQRVRLENAPGLEPRNGRGDAEDVLHRVDSGVVLDDFGLGRRRLRLSKGRERQEQDKSREMDTHESPPRIRKRSATQSRSGVNPNRGHHRALACLVFSSGSHESESRSPSADCFARTERDINLVRHRGEARFGWGNEVVRGRRACRRLAEVRRLLAPEIRQ